MSIAEMCRYAELVREGPATLSERNELLKSHRDAVRQRIAELQADLVVIDAKIEKYSVMERDSVTIRQE